MHSTQGHEDLAFSLLPPSQCSSLTISSNGERLFSFRNPSVTECLFIKTSIPTRNVILFGETNSGKTSIINMIARTSVAPISNDLRGTHDCTVYPIQLGELEYAVYDTPGIDATALGTDPVTKLVEDLQHGVCLLVFCMRGRVTEDAAAIYQHFRSLFKKVPVLAVITGLEHEDPMESWWTKNHSVFDKNDMSFIDHACVTTLRGKGSVFARQYEDSTKVVRNLIAACCLKEGQKAVNSFLVLSFFILTSSPGIAKATACYHGSPPHSTAPTAPQALYYYFHHYCFSCYRRHHHRYCCLPPAQWQLRLKFTLGF